MIKYNTLSAIFCAAFAVTAQAKVVDLLEDYSVSKAPQEIIDITERVANKIGFSDAYEVAVPTKAGIQLNPWNKFVSYTINPNSKNLLILINPEWFLKLPAEQQDFLIGRYFVMFQEGQIPLSAKVTGYIFIIISLSLMLGLFFLLSKTRLSAQPTWVRIVIAIALIIAAEKLVLDKIEIKIKQYFIYKHAYITNEMTVQKLGNRDAAIKAFEQFDVDLKTELKNGMFAFAPFEKTFEKYIQEIKK